MKAGQLLITREKAWLYEGPQPPPRKSLGLLHSELVICLSDKTFWTKKRGKFGGGAFTYVLTKFGPGYMHLNSVSGLPLGEEPKELDE